MQRKISPASAIRGTLTLPGDKSVSHRYAMIASIAEGPSRITNYSTGADCHSTLGCMRALGVEIDGGGTEFTIHGRGLNGLRAPSSDLDAGNSGSTIRMLSGILAGQSFTSRIMGDESLSRRPMQRIMTPLENMGARVSARDRKFPPLEIHGGALTPTEYLLPMASAQVKTCVLFAGLYADGQTTVVEPVKSRDHSEIALREFGADVTVDSGRITIGGRPRLTGRDLQVPSDLSSAAFFIVAALMVPGSELTIRGVGLNPTRSALLDVLAEMGAHIRVPKLETVNGELIGDIVVEHSPIKGGVIQGALTAALIDEIPALAVLGAATSGGIEIKDAGELRVKETDRITTVVDNLKRAGLRAFETANGMVIPGKQKFRAAQFDSFGDHRIAMAFAVAALTADGECTIDGAEAASVSFPELWDKLKALAG